MRKFNKGQSMFELLVAVFVVAVSLTAIVSLVTNSISNSTFSRERTLATKYTQEAVEWLRSERDENWGTFSERADADGNEYCMSSLSWDAGGCSSTEYISGTAFVREVTLYLNDAYTVEARIVTTWSDQSGVHESRISTYFTNWRTR